MAIFRTVTPAGLDARLRELLGRYATNAQSVTLPANNVCAWAGDNTIVLASALSADTSDVAGIPTVDIAGQTVGYIQNTGRIAGSLVGLGAVAGQPVFLSEVPGAMTLTAPTPTTSSIVRIGFAVPADNQNTVSEAQDLLIDIAIISEP